MNKEKQIKRNILTLQELKALKADDWIYTIYLRSNFKQYHHIAKNDFNGLWVYDNVCCLDLVELNYADYEDKWVAYKNKEQAEIE